MWTYKNDNKSGAKKDNESSVDSDNMEDSDASLDLEYFRNFPPTGSKK